MVPGGMRNIHDNKVSGQMASNSANHNSSDDYMGMVHGTMGSGVRRLHTRTQQANWSPKAWFPLHEAAWSNDRGSIPVTDKKAIAFNCIVEWFKHNDSISQSNSQFASLPEVIVHDYWKYLQHQNLAEFGHASWPNSVRTLGPVLRTDTTNSKLPAPLPMVLLGFRCTGRNLCWYR